MKNIKAMARDGLFCAQCFSSTFPTTRTGLLLPQCNQKLRNSTSSITKVGIVIWVVFLFNFEISPEVKRICTVSYGLGLPGCLAATIVLSKYGLRVGLYIGATLTVTGGLLCCLSSLSLVTEFTPPPTWYWLAVVGQGLSGLGSPFMSCVPTKVIRGNYEMMRMSFELYELSRLARTGSANARDWSPPQYLGSQIHWVSLWAKQ